MASTWRSAMWRPKSPEPILDTTKLKLDGIVDRVLENKMNITEVFAILETLQSENVCDVYTAIDACSKLFTELLKRKELFVGKLPEEDALSGEDSDLNCTIFLRLRYNNCVEILIDLLKHPMHEVKESAVCCLMQFATEEGNNPLEDLDWREHYSFPKELIQGVVDGLLSQTAENIPAISKFYEYLDLADVRYYVMSFIRLNVAKVMDQNNGDVLPQYQSNTFALMSILPMPKEESELSKFMVKQEAKHKDWKVTKLSEHRSNFERMWLCFLKYKLPKELYKKILVNLHETVLPHMKEPTLLLDFLTSAYETGGAVSLLALNGLFVLMHQYNLEYPDFYNKLYNILDESLFFVKYKGRFFHLTDIFLSSSHLPNYLVAAFIKRLARLALSAPTPDLFIVLPFIYNLIRRHPSCKVLIHRPEDTNRYVEDPYIMEEEDPALCNALESSLWEIETLQSHYHPDIAKTAMLINKPLSEQEDDINELLDITTLKLMEKELDAVEDDQEIPMQFEKPTGLLTGDDILGQHFELA